MDVAGDGSFRVLPITFENSTASSESGSDDPRHPDAPGREKRCGQQQHLILKSRSEREEIGRLTHLQALQAPASGSPSAPIPGVITCVEQPARVKGRMLARYLARILPDMKTEMAREREAREAAVAAAASREAQHGRGHGCARGRGQRQGPARKARSRSAAPQVRVRRQRFKASTAKARARATARLATAIDDNDGSGACRL